MDSKNYHELHSRLYDCMSRFFLNKNVVIMICRSGRHRSVANAEIEHVDRLRSTSTLCFLAALVRAGFLEEHVCRKVFGMQQTVHQNLPDTLRVFTTCFRVRFCG